MINHGIKVKGRKTNSNHPVFMYLPALGLSVCFSRPSLLFQIYYLLSLPCSESQEADFLDSFTRPLALVGSSNQRLQQQINEQEKTDARVFIFCPIPQACPSERVQAVAEVPWIPPGSFLYVLSFSQMVPFPGLRVPCVPVTALLFPFRLRGGVDFC